MAPSFERLDYQLRYNKHIERRLIFELLAHAAGRFPLKTYRYLGLGSIWFADFRLAHRLLGISDMVSMEYEDHAPRAKFNKPFRSVSVLPGECSATLKTFSAEDWSNPVICWMDYDGPLSPSVCDDVSLILDRCSSGSVLLLTVNGQRGTYRPRLGRDERKREETAIGQIEALLGKSAISPDIEPGMTPAGFQIDVPDTAFPKFVASSLLTFMGHATTSSARRVPVHTNDGTQLQALTFTPIFNFSHQDGADMITVGGVVATSDQANEWKALTAEVREQPQFEPPAHEALDLVPLTIKEKLQLDSWLPHGEDDFIAAVANSDISLSAEQVTKYRRYYRHFPAFVDVPI
jgi:hypothetical protein